MRKILALALLFTCLIAAPAFAKDARIEQVENWFNNLTTGQARFEQRGYDGSALTGNFYISRPGRLRFEYDPPTKDFVVADGTFLYFHDAEQNQTSSAPIGTTLADFLLRSRFSLGGDLRVSNIREKDGFLSLAVTQAADPAAGQLEMRFTQVPFQLHSWRIIDAQGLASEIILTNFRQGVPVPPALFVFKDPTGKGRMND